MLAPDRFVLGTIAAAAGDALVLDPVRRLLAERVWPSIARHVEIRAAELGDDGPYLAALCAALEGEDAATAGDGR